MSEKIRQKVRFDNDNKLVVETDYGRFYNGESSTVIKGDFVIEAVDVTKLLVGYDKIDFKSAKYVFDGRFYDGYAVIGVSEYIDIVKSQEAKINELNEKIKEYCTIEKEYKMLKKAIEDFNKTRKWFERKFEILKYLHLLI